MKVSSKDNLPECKINEDMTIFNRIYVIIKLAYPLLVSFMIRQGHPALTLFFTGYISKVTKNTKIFAGISLASMFMNVAFISICQGMATAIVTLCSRYNGSNNFIDVGIVLHQGYFILSCMAIPLSLLLYHSYNIFILIGVEKTVCLNMFHFLKIISLSIPIRIFLICYRKFIISIG